MKAEKLKTELFEENDGSKISKTVKALKKCAKTERERVIDVFSEYVKNGNVKHWRGFIASELVDLIKTGESKYADVFEQGLKNPETSYWSVDGLIKTAGRDSYIPLTSFAINESNDLESRANAIKKLANHSHMTFIKGLPVDPGQWKHEQLPIADLKKWLKDGFPNGEGFESPEPHSSLKNPKTEIEKLAVVLEKKLSKLRANNQDLSNPTNWLIPGDRDRLKIINTKWKLPETYNEFLMKFSPLQVSISAKGIGSGIDLFGVSNLIEGQNGYSFNPITKQAINNWPNKYVVIACKSGDPYVLDLSNVKDGDSCVLTAKHGTGDWAFKQISTTFKTFILKLSK